MNGNDLVRNVEAWLARYVRVSDDQRLVLALWALHTWIYDRLSRTTPYIEITGVSGSGKTTVMEALSLLSRGSLILNTLRTLAMCRYINEHEGRVTIFIDEAERLESGSFGDQRSMLASGYRKGGEHLVSIGKSTAMMPVWCPKVFTSLRTVTDVIHNRSIPIWLERLRPEASLALEWERAEATAAEIIEQFRAVLAGIARPLTVEADWLTNERDREIWTPLVSLAHTLQLAPETLNRLTAASVDLSSLRGVLRRMDVKDVDEGAAERSFAIRLIRDVRTVIEGETEAAVFSRDLVNALRAIPTAPWRSYNRTGLNEIALAQLLGAFGLESDTVQRGKGRKGREQAKGYKVSALRAAAKQADA